MVRYCSKYNAEDQKGAGLVEYVLLAALIATMGIASVKLLGINTGASLCHSTAQIANDQTLEFNYTSYECSNVGSGDDDGF